IRKNGFGYPIRFLFVLREFHLTPLVKDHRTNTEVGNVQAVMDGEIDPFIDAYLRSRI
ncbi:hypothetical protein ACT453_32175, partial [Bacillus sp. D-CC]